MASHPPADEPEKRVGPLELFFDLVFVFALTQVTARHSDDLSAGGMLRGLLVLAAVWWAWAAYAWLTNEVDGSRGSVRLAIFVAMAAMLLASLTIPGAFEDDALAFALAYLSVRLMHIVLFAAGTDDVDVRQAARALAPTAVLAPALLILASTLDDNAQIAVWVVALLIDYIGGALRGIEGWKLSPGHFAERHGLIVIIALGESIVAIGSAQGTPRSAPARWSQRRSASRSRHRCGGSTSTRRPKKSSTCCSARPDGSATRWPVTRSASCTCPW